MCSSSGWMSATVWYACALNRIAPPRMATSIPAASGLAAVLINDPGGTAETRPDANAEHRSDQPCCCRPFAIVFASLSTCSPMSIIP